MENEELRFRFSFLRLRVKDGMEVALCLLHFQLHRIQLDEKGVPAEFRYHVSVTVASSQCPTLRDKRVSPHALRHTTAMHFT